MADYELAPVAPELKALPSPREFGAAVQARVDAEIKRFRSERGEVTTAADVYPLVRGLTAASEQLGDYATALTRVNTSIKQEIEEELMAVPGNEQDHTPVAGMTVPDTDGTDIKIALDQSTKREFDTGSLIAVAVAEQTTPEAMREIIEAAFAAALDEEQVPKLTEVFAAGVEAGIRRVLGLGTFTPQITKVKAYAKDAASAGADSEAAVIQGAVREKRVHKGIKVTREERK